MTPDKVSNPVKDNPILSEASRENRAVSDLGKKAIKSTAWLGTATMVGQIFSWAVTIVVARLLTPEDYGLIGIANILTGFCIIVNDLGLGSAIIQRKEATEDQLSGIFLLSIVFSLLLYSIVFFGAPLLASFFNEPKAVAITRVVGLTIILSGFKTIPYSLMTKKIAFKKRAMAQFAAVLCAGIISLTMAIAGLGVWALVTASLVREAVLTIMCFWLWPWVPSLSLKLNKLRDHVIFGITVLGNRVTFYVYSQVDSIIVGRILGASTLGIFTMGRTLATIPNDKICNIVNQVAFPVFSKIQDDIVRIKKFIFKTLRMEMGIIIPLMLGGALTSYDLIPVVLSDKWASLCPVFVVMCFLATLGGPGSLFSTILMARDRADWLFWRTLTCSVIYPLVLYPVGLKWGLTGLLTSLLILLVPKFSWLLYFCYADMKISGRDYIRELFPIPISAVLMTSVVLACLFLLSDNVSRLVRLIACCSIGAAGYLLSMRLLFPSFVHEAINNFRQLRE